MKRVGALAAVLLLFGAALFWRAGAQMPSQQESFGTITVGVPGNATPAPGIAALQMAQIGAVSLTTTTGELGFGKITASGTAPGAGGAKIEAVCGTNSGSIKLIAYAGTSATPVTILDNIGSGVTGC